MKGATIEPPPATPWGAGARTEASGERPQLKSGLERPWVILVSGEPG